MRFRAYQCWFPKDIDFPNEYEDASALSEKHGLAIVADGVSSAIFSRDWARLLTRSAVASIPDLRSEDSIQQWLGPLQQQWRQGINFQALPWHQKPKATSVGAQATLLMVQVAPFDGDESGGGEYQLRASGIGDCVLFLVRDGHNMMSFPLADAAAFAEPPEIFSSIAKGVHYGDKFLHLDERCRVGDLLVLCSDAVGLWAMQEYEAGRQVDWMRYWNNDEAWQQDIQQLRTRSVDEDGHRMRVDDCTLLLLQIIHEEVHDGEPDVQPDRSDEPFVLFGPHVPMTDEAPTQDDHVPADCPQPPCVQEVEPGRSDEARPDEQADVAMTEDPESMSKQPDVECVPVQDPAPPIEAPITSPHDVSPEAPVDEAAYPTTDDNDSPPSGTSPTTIYDYIVGLLDGRRRSNGGH
jgi:hypothetical protein